MDGRRDRFSSEARHSLQAAVVERDCTALASSTMNTLADHVP